MKLNQMFVLVLIVSSATLMAFASEDAVIFLTKEDAKQSKYLDPSITETDLSLKDAETILISENPEVIAKSINGEIIDKDGFGLIWQLSSKTTDGNSIISGINASTGELLFVYDGAKNVQGNDSISKNEALEIAEEYIQSKLTTEKINEVELEKIAYREPAADDLPGTYKISYARVIREIPSLSDGIQLRVNAETGEVSSYRKRWSMNEDEIALIDIEPSIKSEEAVGIIKEFMGKESYIGEEKADTVRVISSTLVWKEDDEDKIHLTWEIQFMDSSFAEDDKYPASAWIDSHSGKMLLFDYVRD
ncbi:YcdB/YcdC domain-containing protein [Methanococcoides methylutens]|uniref:YcdB/YcdC domain-containing protein n=1 Tax=Methanococcoides methylutens TaxID=2226 RepID=UPI0040446461